MKRLYFKPNSDVIKEGDLGDCACSDWVVVTPALVCAGLLLTPALVCAGLLLTPALVCAGLLLLLSAPGCC